jgi:hypothetical protein
MIKEQCIEFVGSIEFIMQIFRITDKSESEINSYIR